MPFTHYFNDDRPSHHDYQQSPVSPSTADLHHDPSIFSTNVQFQVPPVIIGAPTLAPGGGAEVLPQGYLPPQPSNTNPLSAAWWSDTPYDRYSSDL